MSQTRKPKSVFIDVNGRQEEWEILNICEFNSSRKRMSTVVRGPDGRIKLYTKGADTVIYERLAPKQEFAEPTLVNLEDYATEGLRTLCLAYRDIPEEEYREWAALYDNAAAQLTGRADALDKVAEIIEQNLQLLGATAIEDRLQDGVPDTIHTLQQAGIKVWILTGDRQETAINIGLSCRLISESMNLVIINTETQVETNELLNKRLFAIRNQRLGGDVEELALIIDGRSLTYALEKECSDVFLELAIMCKVSRCPWTFADRVQAVICCRVSPLQKALVVKLVKKSTTAPLLAIGDGANDVSMIQAAHVGVGISGVEGLQAARSADVAISQFRFLRKLLLVHGSWSYQRLSKLILYSFYKNITFALCLFWVSYAWPITITMLTCAQYSWVNDFSGQISFEGWTMTFYNVVFTILPPLVIGIFDQFVSARMLDRYPQLYQLGQNNYFFTPITFFYWVGNAIYHSVVSCYSILFLVPKLTCPAALCLLVHRLLGGSHCCRRQEQRALGLGNHALSCSSPNGPWQGCPYLGVSITLRLQSAQLTPFQRLDKVHDCSDSRLLHLHHDRASAVRFHCAVAQLLPRVQGHCSSALGGRRVLLCPYPLPHHLSSA